MGVITRTGVLIIGTGFSGIGMGIALQKQGIDFLILEKKFEIGGTWRDNTYPGCACDIPSHLYSFSFEQNANWSKLWPPQSEIQEYLLGVVRKYKLRRNIKFGCTVTRAWWDDQAMEWHVQTTDGEEFVAQFVVSGAGALHIPSIPEFDGLGEFTGTKFHSAEWDHSVDLRASVAVIGTGASAIQIVPSIIDDVAELKLFQRTPPWVMPWSNWKVPEGVKRMFARFPITQKAFRAGIFWAHEYVGYAMSRRPELLKIAEMLGKWNIRRSVKDPVLRRKLTPNFSFGCKRVLKGGKKKGIDYYGALAEAKSEVITDPIKRIEPKGIVTSDGELHEVDVIVFATGFHVTDSYQYMQIIGQQGEDLKAQADAVGVIAHRGIMFADVPNLFLLLGPNTGLGHNSIVVMIEAQIRYVIQAIKAVQKSGNRALFPTWGAQNHYNAKLQRKLEGTVWNSGCNSWYFDEHGNNRTLWSGTAWRYVQSVRKLRQQEFVFFKSGPYSSR